MTIGIGIPTPDRISPDFAISNLQEILNYTKIHLPDIKILIRYQQGVRTDRNRNVILQDFIDQGDVDYILWLDADMIFPADIIERYLELEKLHGEMSVIGCLYFKRTDDYNPIGYTFSDKPEKPFRPVMPQLIKRGHIYEVAGIGYGGMLVPMSVYEELGDDKWTHYGDKFYIPGASDGNLTHDLEFCQTLKKHNHKIFLHGSVRPGHIGEKLITEQDFYEKFPPKLLNGLKVLVVMPSTDRELAEKAAEVMKNRAGYDCDIRVIVDEKRLGFVKTINSVFKVQARNYDFIVYTAQDAFVGGNWLANALLQQFKHQAGLLAFNDGKWNGRLASFGMVDTKWSAKNYDGYLFYPEYHSHYADTELTQIAKEKNEFIYAENAVMMEIDYIKGRGESRGVVQADKKLYKKRIKQVVNDENLQKEFK